MARDVVRAAEPTGRHADVDAARGQRGDDPAQLLGRIVRVQMLHQLMAVDDVGRPRRHRHRHPIGQPQLEIARQVVAARDLAADVHSDDLARRRAGAKRQRAVARADLGQCRAWGQKTPQQVHLRVDLARSRRRGAMRRELRMVGHAPEQLVVERGVEPTALRRRRVAQPVREFALDVVVGTQALRAAGLRGLGKPLGWGQGGGDGHRQARSSHEDHALLYASPASGAIPRMAVGPGNRRLPIGPKPDSLLAGGPAAPVL